MRILLLLLLFAGKAWANAGIEFISNDLTTARVQAQREQKMTVVKFTAEWCPPCKVMDEYVWTDERVIDYVAQNCIAVKVDIDNFDGITYKQHFSIDRLPTTLLLDACGNEVARFENYVSAGRLVSWMEMFDKKEHRACSEGNSVALPEAFLSAENLLVSRSEVAEPPARVAAIAVSDRMPVLLSQPVESPARNVVSAENGSISENLNPNFAATPPDSSGRNFIDDLDKPSSSAVAPGQVPEKKNRFRIFSKPKTKPAAAEPSAEKPQQFAHVSSSVASPSRYENHPEETPATSTTTGEMVNLPAPYSPPPAPAAAPAMGSRLFWEMGRPAGFAVQVFASSTSTGAEEMKTACLSQFDLPVAVVSPRHSNDNLYRVMVGFFPTRAEADAFKKLVKGKHRDAFVKDLSRL